MKCLLIAAVALLILASVSPVLALTQDEAQQIARDAGSTATVYVEAGNPELNAYYAPWQNTITLLGGLQRLPESWQRFILYHEIGHSLQHQEGRIEMLRHRGPHEVEWDADAYAIKMMTDGAGINADIWAYVWRISGMEGSDRGPHGTIVDRIMRGWLNKVQVHVESSFL